MPKNRKTDTPEYKRRRRIRYQLIIENTGDTKLANRARSWSDDRILHELGFYIPKRIKHHRIAQPPKPVIIPIEKPIKAKKPKKLTKQQIIDQAKHERYLLAKAKRKARIFQSRVKEWANWSGPDKDRFYETDPTWRRLVNAVHRVNKLKGNSDPDDKMGYSIVYNAFIHQESIADWMEKMIFIGFDHETYRVTRLSRKRGDPLVASRK